MASVIVKKRKKDSKDRNRKKVIVRKKTPRRFPTKKKPIVEVVQKPSPQWQPERLSRRRNTYEGAFNWTPKRVMAARLLATGEFSKVEVAETIEVSDQTIYYWLSFVKFYTLIEKLVLETGLAGEADRVQRVKKRVRQLNNMIDRKVETIMEDTNVDDFGRTPLDFVPITSLLGAENKLLEMLEKRESGVDQTVRHVITGEIDPDKKKVDVLQEIIASLPDEAAKAFKNTLVIRAQKFIEARQSKKEEEDD